MALVGKVQRSVSQIKDGTLTYKQVETSNGITYKPDEYLKKALGYNKACMGFHFTARTAGSSNDKVVCYFHCAKVWTDA